MGKRERTVYSLPGIGQSSGGALEGGEKGEKREKRKGGGGEKRKSMYVHTTTSGEGSTSCTGEVKREGRGGRLSPTILVSST